MFKKAFIACVTVAAISMPALAQNSGASQYQYYNWLNNKNNQSQSQTQNPSMANTNNRPAEHREFNNNSNNTTNNTLAADQSNSKQTNSQRHGLYLSLGAAATFPTDSSVENNLGIDNSESLNIGPGATGAIGLYLGDFRFEAEAGYRYNTIDSLSVSGFGLPLSGHLQSLSLMGNLYYDIALSPTIDLYIGGGAGSAKYRVNASILGYSDAGNSDWEFAYQGMAGLSFQIDKKVYLTVGYRYFSSLDPSIKGVQFDAPGSHEATAGLRIDL